MKCQAMGCDFIWWAEFGVVLWMERTENAMTWFSRVYRSLTLRELFMDGIAIRKSQHLIKFPFVIVLIENCTIRPSVHHRVQRRLLKSLSTDYSGLMTLSSDTWTLLPAKSRLQSGLFGWRSCSSKEKSQKHRSEASKAEFSLRLLTQQSWLSN